MRAIFFVILLSFLSNAACALTNEQIKQKLIERSIAAYLGTYAVCPCPYSKDKHGDPCGNSNAWTTDNEYSDHHSVYCYPKDVPDSAVVNFRNNQSQ